MKRLVIILCVLTLGCISSRADSYLGVNVAGAYPWHKHADSEALDMALGNSKLVPSSGYRGEIGVAYNYQYRGFLLSIGADVAFQEASLKQTSMVTATSSAFDERGIDYEYQILVYPRKDRLQQLDVEIPLALGAEISNFYFLVGAKVCFNTYGKTLVNATYTTQADYDERYYEPINLGSTEATYTNQEAVRLSLGARAILEAGASIPIGGQFSRKGGKQKLRIAAFAEIGITGQQIPLTYTSAAEPSEDGIKLHHFYSVQLNSDSEASSLQPRAFCAGLKLTYLLPLHVQTRKSISSGKYKCKCEK